MYFHFKSMRISSISKFTGVHKAMTVRTIQIYVLPCWFCFLNFISINRAEIINFPYEQTTKFVPVTEPARLPGSYEEARKASRVEMSSRARTHTTSSGESNVFRVFRGITKRLTQPKKWLIRWTKEKISSVQSSQLLLEVSAYSKDINDVTYCY